MVAVPLENGIPRSFIFEPNAFMLLASATVSVVEPEGAACVTITQVVALEPVVGQNAASAVSIRPLDS